MEYPFGHRGSAVLAVHPHQLLTPPASSLREQSGEKALTLRQPCSAAGKTLKCYQHWFSHKSKTQHPTSASEGTPLCPSQTQSGSAGGGEPHEERARAEGKGIVSFLDKAILLGSSSLSRKRSALAGCFHPCN